MRNLNNDEIEKYEKLTRNIYLHFTNKVNISNLQPMKIFRFGIYAGLFYLAFSIYRFRRQKRKNCVSVFNWKRQISSSVWRSDLWHKITQSNFKEIGAQTQATQLYENMLRERFEEDIQLKIVNALQVDNEVEKKEILLTEYKKAKLDLGSFQLHAKSSNLIINKAGDLVKRTVQTPIVIMGAPFRSKQKQGVKMSKKKTKPQKMVEAKARFDLNSQCKVVNKINLYLAQPEKKKQILLDCKSRVEELEKKLISSLQKKVKEKNII